MKIKIEIKNRWTGKLIFEYSKSDNTLLKTLIEAINQGADLRVADLRGAYLRVADLRGADLRGADLRGAYLRGADLQGADLRGAYLRVADLQVADLRGADLRGADLQGAYLRGADLQGAYLRGAYLRGAYLRGAYLRVADLIKIKHLFQIIPEEGSFIAWKKIAKGCIAKIEIPKRSPRSCNIINRKCRAKFVKTLLILNKENKPIKEMHGQRDANTIYKVGRLTHTDKWDSNMLVDCTHGIHFFVTKEEALKW